MLSSPNVSVLVARWRALCVRWSSGRMVHGHACIAFLAKIKNYFLMSLKLTDEQQLPCLELLRCDMLAETQYSGGIWL